jgi:4-hydroxythreonine-4-phosphate dehydrogenase
VKDAAGTASPLVALTVGDTAGIGPEIASAVLRDEDLARRARLLVLGPARLRPAHVQATEAPEGMVGHGWMSTADHGPVQVGAVQRGAGLEALAALRAGHELALARRVDALVTGPVNKEALHLAGERVEGQTELLGRWCGVERVEMMAVAGRLRVILCTRHMPLRRALDTVTTERVLDRARLFERTLRSLGVQHPRLAVCGWNPHAGEHGLLGSEDDEILAPAVAVARAEGLDVHGPISPDSVFRQAAQGEWDGVVALWHDQAFIPLKLLDPLGGVTALCGLPYLRLSPAHGTAFDIAGQGRADARNLLAALRQALEWAPNWHS